MDKSSVLIIKRTENEFVFEYDTKAEASEMKEGLEFEYDNIKYRAKTVQPGMTGPTIYTFLVIAEMVL